VRIHEVLARASQFTVPRWRAARDEGREEEMRLWHYVDEHISFINGTGQAYQFEDYLEGIAPSPRPYVSAALGASGDATSVKAMDLILKALDETAEPEQKQLALILIGLLDFMADTEQVDDFEDYFKNRLEYAPLAIASFTTRDEARAWLDGLAEPPSPARILIGDEYHQLWCSREDGTRDISRDYILEPYLEALTARGLPPTMPSFDTRLQAEEWLTNHPATPFAFVSIAGEHYLAVRHKRLTRYTFHHVASTLKEWEEEKKRFAERQRELDAEYGGSGTGE
jgi:hypothetical protein